MMGDLIGEFKGKNTTYRVLPDGNIETSGQGTGKILGIDAFIMFTTVTTTTTSVFVGEGNGLITTINGDKVIMKMDSISWQSEKGGVTRGASYQMTDSEKLMRLNKVIGLHELETDEMGNWTGKIWEWK